MDGTTILGLSLLAALGTGAVQYWQLLGERVHRRRTEERLDDVRHVSAVARAHLAESLRRA